jgi:hypothetical protein
MLTFYGERELAEDDTFQVNLIQAAAKASENQLPDSIVLDAQVFATLLTSDVRLYEISNEVRLTTHFDDVFSKNRHVDFDEKSAEEPDRSELDLSPSKKKDVYEQAHVTHIYTAPAIDISAGTFRSKTLIVLLWSCTLITYFAYIYGSSSLADDCDSEENSLALGNSKSPWADRSVIMLCQTVASIARWIGFFISLSLFGLIFAGIGSSGNSVQNKKWWAPLFGVFVISLITVALFVGETLGSTFSSDKKFLQTVSFILGILVSVYHLMHSVTLLLPKSMMEKNPQLNEMVSASTIRTERDAKMALSKKLSKMLTNAINVHQKVQQKSGFKSYYGQALKVYSRLGREFETVGGFFWTWRSVYDKTIFNTEGVWLSVRLLSSNFTQYIACIYILWSGIVFTINTMKDYDPVTARANIRSKVDEMFRMEVNQNVTEGLEYMVVDTVAKYVNSMGNWSGVDIDCSNQTETNFYCIQQNAPVTSTDELLYYLNETGFDATYVSNVTNSALQEASYQLVDTLYPTQEYMVRIPLIIAVIVAFLTSVNLATSYIPSVTATVLKLRCGVIDSLHSRDMQLYRVAPETVALLTGSLFWGCLVASLLAGSLTGLIAFFFLWQGSVVYAQKFVALAVGILVMALMRLGLVMFCRKNYYQGFYRKKPAAANYAMLCLEWANFALSAGFIVVRMIKLLYVAVTSVGRIDIPFLAPGLGRIGPLELDNFPTIHTRDVLLHEAHRHPYIELLGTMYLMKIRYTKHFGNMYGSFWRLMFVHALMPWLHRYRVTVEESDDAAANDEFATPTSGLIFNLKGSMAKKADMIAMLEQLKAENEQLKRDNAELRDRLVISESSDAI